MSEPIRFACEHCQKRLKVDARYAGREVKCPRCAKPLLVPPPVEAAPSEPEPTHLPADDEEGADGPLWPGSHYGAKEESEAVDLTSMVDVVFQLLIFFMVTAAFSLQKSIEVPPPDTTEAAAQTRTLEELEEDDDFVIIRIDRDNTIWVNDSEAFSEQEMLTRLRELRSGEGGSVPNSLMVMAAGEALHHKVISALDAGVAEKFEHVRLATMEEDDF